MRVMVRSDEWLIVHPGAVDPNASGKYCHMQRWAIETNREDACKIREKGLRFSCHLGIRSDHGDG